MYDIIVRGDKFLSENKKVKNDNISVSEITVKSLSLTKLQKVFHIEPYWFEVDVRTAFTRMSATGGENISAYMPLKKPNRGGAGRFLRSCR